MSFTAWSSSPGATSESLVLAFGGLSRVERVGVTTAGKDREPVKVRLEASADGRAWREVAAIAPAGQKTTMTDVAPFDARYLRATTVGGATYYSALASVHAIGREIQPPERHSFDGCWSINTTPARLVQRGARVTGVLGGARQPTFVDGGIEGRVAKLMWMRGPMWGRVTATLTPDGNGISAVTFHEEPQLFQIGESWIGNRCDDTSSAASLPAAAGPAAYLRRVGHWTMSGVVFDAEERLLEEPSRAALDAAVTLIRTMPAQRCRIVAREFRHNDPNENRRRTMLRVDAVRHALRARGIDVSRITFAGEGSAGNDIEKPSAVQRMLWSRIDLMN
jgi:hypothetical protein